jgi:hypothetical protein
MDEDIGRLGCRSIRLRFVASIMEHPRHQIEAASVVRERY